MIYVHHIEGPEGAWEELQSDLPDLEDQLDALLDGWLDDKPDWWSEPVHPGQIVYEQLVHEGDNIRVCEAVTFAARMLAAVKEVQRDNVPY